MFHKVIYLEIKKFIIIIVSIHLILLGIAALNIIGLELPILRQIIGFIYLSIIPGVLILRIMKLYKVSDSEIILYTISLSLASLMFIGFFMNLIYPLIGITRPISFKYLLLTINVFTLSMCIICYLLEGKNNRNINLQLQYHIKEFLSPTTLFLFLVPFLSIFGTYLTNYYKNSILLTFLILVIGLLYILGFYGYVDRNRLPFLIYMTALALLFHTSLLTNYLVGWDIHQEYYFSKLVKLRSYWDNTLPFEINSMLSITILAPVYSIILGIGLVWVYKIIYPTFFSLVPLGLYHIFRTQTNDKIAFLSCFYFISMFYFFRGMVGLARQQIAELFFVSLILLMMNKEIDKSKRLFLFIIFGMALIVSHYGVAYIYLYLLSFYYLVIFLLTKSNRLDDTFTSERSYVIIYALLLLTWYIYSSGSSNLGDILYVINNIIHGIFTDFLDPSASKSLQILVYEPLNPIHKITKAVYILTELFVTIGIIKLLLSNPREMNFSEKYAIFSVLSFMLCIGGIIIPYLTGPGSMGPARIYHLALFFLSPFCIIGGITFFKVLMKVSKIIVIIITNTKKYEENIDLKRTYDFLLVLLLIFFLLNTNFIDEIITQKPMMIASRLSRYEQLNTVAKVSVSYVYTHVHDVFSAKWVSKYRDNSKIIFSDFLSAEQPIMSYGMICYRELPHPVKFISKATMTHSISGYIYLSYLNSIDGVLIRWPDFYNKSEINPILITNSKIYTNGGSEIYYI